MEYESLELREVPELFDPSRTFWSVTWSISQKGYTFFGSLTPAFDDKLSALLAVQDCITN